MIQFIETICVHKGRVYNIEAHNRRCFSTRRAHFENQQMFNLRRYIILPKSLLGDTIKCRIIYSDQVLQVQYEAYCLQPINSLQITVADHLEYKYKYRDRHSINELMAMTSCDDILIVKEGLVKDSSFTNVAFQAHDCIWYTPAVPLLAGTMREKLIQKKVIVKQDIKVDSLLDYKQISLFNAMIPFGKIVLPIKHLCS